MKIIFLGGLFPDKYRKEIEQKSSGVIQYAADALQWNMIRGLDDFVNDLTIVNLPYIGSYPTRYKEINTSGFEFSHKPGANDINVAFNNLSLYKLYSRYINAKKALKKKITQGNEVVVIYSMHLPFIKAAVALKKNNPNLKICLVVPDLPEFMGGGQNIFYTIFKKIEKVFIDKALLKINFFVILSKHMKEALNIGARPWVCVEGIAGSIDFGEKVFPETKDIFYSGTLAKQYGIVNLLNAFKKIQNKNYRLIICGAGEAQSDIEAMAKLDSRIIFMGQLPRERILELQKKATVLVNPRTSEGEFTKYSFPSKTMEYLASGTACILHRLEGIPEEYFDFCFVAEKQDFEGLYETLIYVCEKDKSELYEFGAKAQQFILNEKSAHRQSEKIYLMLKKYTNV
ncbi:glycosyltransferase family 4 protein [Mucilaginibacter corticis]|uniref:Glycosyltransferase family 4 protein n=1 Tax=Mucilaginibacter corticis TaxID=2597670 RepID=A0A556MT21_9SPHI|nr:glycosyltransferase [Mucilaginibacter corticis]TSJ43073.1 glycosyltransferase family 4 protein [Mucilaginibacter corticis]